MDRSPSAMKLQIFYINYNKCILWREVMLYDNSNKKWKPLILVFLSCVRILPLRIVFWGCWPRLGVVHLCTHSICKIFILIENMSLEGLCNESFGWRIFVIILKDVVSAIFHDCIFEYDSQVFECVASEMFSPGHCFSLDNRCVEVQIQFFTA